MKRSLGWCILGLAAALLASVPARADISFGYEARYVGLGGAGLALIDNPKQAAQVNPAALGLRRMGLGIQWPNMAFRWRGAGLGEAIDHLTSGNAVDGVDEAVDLAREFGKEPTRVEANLGFGLNAVMADLRVRTQATVLVKPRTDFARWATSTTDVGSFLLANYGNEFANVTNGDDVVTQLNQTIQRLGADVLGAAAISPSFGIGMRVPNRMLGNGALGDMHVGVRVKPTRIYYSHYVVGPMADAGDFVTGVGGDFEADGAGLAESGYGKIRVDAREAAELGTETNLSDTSWGMDFGVLWQPAQIPYTTFALTVDNLIEPGFELPGTIEGGATLAGEKLLPRTVNLGAAIQAPGGLILAADLLDVTGANKANPNGEAQFRVGAEFRPRLPVLSMFALRAGYNSATGMAAGLSFGGFGIAYAARSPLIASQTFNF